MNATIKEAYSDTVAAGTVISQSVSSGSKVEIGSSVEIVVSLGKEQVTVPNVVSYDEDRAKQELEAIGLTVSFREINDDQAVGKVIDQSVIGGTRVDKGTTIELTVSLGPAGSSEGSGGSGATTP